MNERYSEDAARLLKILRFRTLLKIVPFYKYPYYNLCTVTLSLPNLIITTMFSAGALFKDWRRRRL